MKSKIVHERIQSGRPQQNSRRELINRTLKDSTTKSFAASLRPRQSRFDNFPYVFNHKRPHKSWNDQVPASLYHPCSVRLPPGSARRARSPVASLYDEPVRVRKRLLNLESAISMLVCIYSSLLDHNSHNQRLRHAVAHLGVGNRLRPRRRGRSRGPRTARQSAYQDTGKHHYQRANAQHAPP
jgi:hypothetical protein